MTAMTVGKPVQKYGELPTLEHYYLDVAASTILLAGSMIAVDLSGNAVAISAAQGRRVIGRCEDSAGVDNSAGIAGALKVRVRRGVYKFINSSTTDAITKADIGRKCFAVDDQTVSRTNNLGNRPIMGLVVGMDGTSVMVEVGGPDPEPNEIRLLAGADLSALQYYAMKLNSSTAVVVAAAGEDVLGVLQNAPASGEVAIVKTWGFTKAIGGAAVTKGAAVAADAAGKFVTATKGTLGAIATTAIATADGSDAASTQTLANAIKAKFNTLITDLNNAAALKGSHALGDAIETGVDATAFTIYLRPRGLTPTTVA